MSDPEIEEIRAARHDISAENGHDLSAAVDYYRSFEEKLRNSGKFEFEDTQSATTPWVHDDPAAALR